MHPDPCFQPDDHALSKAVVEEVGFGMIFAATPRGPRVVHAPLVWSGDAAIQFHVARRNMIAPHLDRAKALCVVNGPDAYISPRWYSDAAQVPTWNYVAIELEGHLRQLDEAGLRAQLARLIETNEAGLPNGTPWTFDQAREKDVDAMLKAIVGFELAVEAWRPTFKLSQNKPATDRERVAQGLEDAGASGVARLMRNLPGMKFAVFDCDGTLIDGQASICDAMEAAFAQQGLAAPARPAIRRAVGLSLPQAMCALAPGNDGIQAALVESYKVAFRAARSAGRVSQPLFAGMAEVLQGLAAAGWTLGIATGMSDRGLAHCLADNGIADLFVTLQTADRHPSKPNPAMLEAALSAAGAMASEAVMIGDTAYDMQMARDANVRGIGVDWGYHHARELLGAGAEVVAESPAQLVRLLLA